MSTEKSSRYWVLRLLSFLRQDCFVEVYLKDGSTIRGKIEGVESRRLSGFLLKEANITSIKDSPAYKVQKCHTMILDTADIVYISAKECEKEGLVVLNHHLDRVLKELSPSEYNTTYVPRASVANGPNIAISRKQQPLQEQPPQQEPQQQHCAWPFGQTTLVGVTILEIPVTDANRLKFWAGIQRSPYKISEKDVAVRVYDKDMTPFYMMMRRIRHSNILKARGLLVVGNRCLIVYEPVLETLASFVSQKKQLEEKNRVVRDEKKLVGLIVRIIRQIFEALDHAHKKSVYHGRLKMDDVYLRYDDDHVNIKLSFAEREEHAKIAEDVENFVGGENADRLSAANLLEELVESLKPKTHLKFDAMIVRIKANRNYDIKCESLIWNISQKISFIHLVVDPLCKNSTLDHGKEVLLWTGTFGWLIGKIKLYCEGIGVKPAKYKDIFSDYVRFIDNTFRHLKEYPADLRDLIGTYEDAMQNFEGSCPNLFHRLIVFARKSDCWDEFLKSTELFLG